ncbi:hypothetical protein [Psychroserpens mesophilus]|uniref:hypothetical protein n=1 Tax=Psychroserpens mesophilus TaxID=325473 RepID=UPI003F496B7B
MEETNSKKSIDVQEVLSLGYIYLLILGIIHNAIYFNLVDVNYLEHSSVLDVLISPISVITSSLKSSMTFLAIILISVIYVKVLIPLLVRLRRNKKKYQSGKHLKKINGLEAFSKNSYALLFIIALFILGYFLGFGYGRGMKNKTQIAENTIENTHKIEFINGKALNAKVLGKNSLSVFYIEKGDKKVSISPIDGNVLKIQKLQNKD